MSRLATLLPSNPVPLQRTSLRRIPALFRRTTSISVVSALEDRNPRSIPEPSIWNPILLKHQSLSISPTTHLARNLGFRPSRELGLLSLLFVLSTAIGAFFSVAVISLPMMNAFRRLAVSADKLSKVVSEEVPVTLSSLKLSGLEINDLTQQLSNLRQRISGNRYGKKERTSMPRSNGGRNNPIIN
ncbi:uncharacterized protein LOC131225548 [Magnolia sinica]|uniref:uncharacterized protein LOC131225548 n=1 Tax=Magnolia sinica TaxID=86752 RepID=UPI00265AC790|nr:uncharacterized protein LOC131225548 [Magnolia sinica]XP_058077069.1 uncharacterized protein LOC131225548 [Magnolia sinica]XP_058077070.1 uncharacterized protein LOC131225548 [Magnolia sinica]